MNNCPHLRHRWQKAVKAATLDQLSDRESQLERHYHAGTITIHEFSRLDGIIMEQFPFIVDKLKTNLTITQP